MADFMIRFLICNVFISGIIGILLIAKRIFKGNLSSRMQYNLWFLLLGLLVVPFIPFRLIGFPQILSWLSSLKSSPTSGTRTAIGEAVGINPAGNAEADDRGVFPGQWALSGGGVEPGERIEEALRREIREELGEQLLLTEITPWTFSDDIRTKTYADGARKRFI